MNYNETKLPELDVIRIAADEARGIRFSLDKHTLIRYNAEPTDKDYMIPDGVTAIGQQAFEYHRKLIQVNIPNGVTAIGEKAFDGCFELTDIVIPDSVTEIGDGAFNGCGRISCADNHHYFTDEAGALFDRKTDTLLHFPNDFSGSYSIPDGVKRIGENAFCHCDDLTQVNIPASVTSIGKEAFRWCKGLTSINIPDGMTSIGDSAFACTGLTSVMLPESLKYIGVRAFFNCGKLTAINIPNSVTGIGKLAFSDSVAEWMINQAHQRAVNQELRREDAVMDKKLLWETDNLRGTLRIANRDGAAIHRYPFEIPSDKAIGPKAKQNILEAAGCVAPLSDYYCVKHWITWHVYSRITPTEHFCFRRNALPDIRYVIELQDDFPSRITFNGTEDINEEFADCLKEIKERQYDDVGFWFCSTPGSIIRKIRKMTDLHYLTFFNCNSYDFPIFQEIGRLKNLRGLWLNGWQTLFDLDRAAVGELRKLKKLETLSIHFGTRIAAAALPELGSLKSLKGLNLQLGTDCMKGNNQKTPAETLSFLRGLENLEILTLQVTPQLSPGDLALPPNLKYLSINGKVCRLPVRPAKKTELKNE